MNTCIEVFWRTPQRDGRATDVSTQVVQVGIEGVQSVRVSDLTFVRGQLSAAEVKRLAQELLVDPIVEGYRWWSGRSVPALQAERTADQGAELAVEVGYRPGVTDPVAEHLLRRARALGIGTVEGVATGTRTVFTGNLSSHDLHVIAEQVLCNGVIQTYTLGPLPPAFVPRADPSYEVAVIPVREADDEALVRMSVERVLFLSLEEMQAIQWEFRTVGRDPTDVELETLAQTWSEHCQHKTFKARIDFSCQGGMERVVPGAETGAPPYEETIDGLLDTYIRGATEELNRGWVRSAFVDNAGIIDFDAASVVSFKVETHNHPSALEPFGGANTGVGGVIRDIIGVSGRPVANTDVLCFGPLDIRAADLPEGVLHPRRIARGVIAGIEDYGNKMGIPTVSGAVLYDHGYVANPLVYCGCVGLARKGQHRRDPQPGDLCVALGGRTGRDGLHGATFSSAELTHETGQTVGSVVQIGDPITEKAMMEAVMRARDEGLYHAITDCGAGGFSSAAGEMGRDVGVEVELSDVPLKYPGLRPWEIWLSEAQERMVLAVPPKHLPRLREICEELDVELTVIGHFTGNGRLRVRYEGKTVADMDMDFLHDGWPRPTMRAEWQPPAVPDVEVVSADDLTPILLRLLADPDVASKEKVIRRYDHEVQGATLVKPLVGAGDDGPSDAVVLSPWETEGWRGIALGCGINPHYGQIDPYAMAWAAVDEALRNVVAVGGDPDHTALLDNFCWGNPALPDRLGALVRAAQGCHDAALAYGTPFISGKDSLNNEYVDPHGEKRAIPPTLLISSLSVVVDARKAVTMDLKRPGDLLYAVGETRAELGGALYPRLHGAVGGKVPAPVPGAIEVMRALHQAISDGLVRACHDLSEGGLAVAAAEMVIAGRVGLEVDLRSLPRTPDVQTDAMALFSESSARFLVEVAPEAAAGFEAALSGRPAAQLGYVTQEGALRVHGIAGGVVVECGVDDLARCFFGEDAKAKPQ
ncbi:MAG: phosphoribosylformylglycinamidine synthase subunit PurL [Chloroflexota bacterium]